MKCPECQSSQIKQHDGETYCHACGLVISDGAFVAPFLTEAEKEHAKLPYLAVAGTGQISGRIFKQQWFLSTREKNTKASNARIEVIANSLKLPKAVRQDSQILFKRAIEQNIAVGRDCNEVLMGCIYAACLQHGIPRTHLDLELHSGISKVVIMRIYNLLAVKLQLDQAYLDTDSLIEHYCGRMGLQPRTVSLALALSRKVKRVLTNRPAYIIAATTAYYAALLRKEALTQRIVGFKTGIHEVTLRRLIKIVKSSILPEDLHILQRDINN